MLECMKGRRGTNMSITVLEPLLSVEEAAAILGISPWTLRKFLAANRIASVHVGRRLLIEPQAVRDFIERGKVANSVPETIAT